MHSPLMRSQFNSLFTNLSTCLVPAFQNIISPTIHLQSLYFFLKYTLVSLLTFSFVQMLHILPSHVLSSSPILRQTCHVYLISACFTNILLPKQYLPFSVSVYIPPTPISGLAPLKGPAPFPSLSGV